MVPENFADLKYDRGVAFYYKSSALRGMFLVCTTVDQGPFAVENVMTRKVSMM